MEAQRRSLGLAFALSVFALTLGTLLGVVSPVPPDPAPPKPKGGQDAPAAKGELMLRVVGLPPGERGRVIVVGPSQSPQGRPYRRTLLPASAPAGLTLRAGDYRVEALPVELRRRHDGIEPGAHAFPRPPRARNVRVSPERRERVAVDYWRVFNPGLRKLDDAVVRVVGDPRSPRQVVLRQGTEVQRGQTLSIAPSAALPVGLLAHVVSVGGGGGGLGGVIVGLRPAGLFEVAPNMSFATGLDAERVGAPAGCDGGAGTSVRPHAELTGFRATGGWITSGLGPFEVKTGARAVIHFRAAAGVDVTAGVERGCRIDLPAYELQGMAGPIPVYGKVEPEAWVSGKAGLKLSLGGSTEVAMGAKIDGLEASRVSRAVPFSFRAVPRASASAEAGIGVTGELGIGAADAANLHVRAANSLSFLATPRRCSLDLKLGEVSVGAEIGTLPVDEPILSANPRNIWQDRCFPAPPPPTPLPLVRATMSWDGDADLDLYAWDEAGSLSYFGDRNGIVDSELVTDVVPRTGDPARHVELFRETAHPYRRYTFGICDFDGGRANVTLALAEADGERRSIQRSLGGPGDREVVTTGPPGAAYVPAFGWCRFIRSRSAPDRRPG